MLVLSRKVGESIQIGDNIFVSVVEVKGGRVRLSFDAPKDIKIIREELAPQVQPETTTAQISPVRKAAHDCLA
ncbi:MAG: carbon storage regulator CsrA [Fuerstiella sp.]